MVSISITLGVPIFSHPSFDECPQPKPQYLNGVASRTLLVLDRPLTFRHFAGLVDESVETCSISNGIGKCGNTEFCSFY